jgi:hypothetical protein
MGRTVTYRRLWIVCRKQTVDKAGGETILAPDPIHYFQVLPH